MSISCMQDDNAAPKTLQWLTAIVWLPLAMTIVAGCQREEPLATVEGTLTMNGQPVDNCLVTFLPESRQKETQGPHSTGLTDEQGRYRLRRGDQREGCGIGSHRVTVQDLSVSTGVQRRDHGTVDAEQTDRPPSRPVRSRVPNKYLSPRSTPLRIEIKPGNQTIDLDVK